jgi:hypothetical protein
VTAVATRPEADILAQELRRALNANRYSPAAAVRVIRDAELAHEMRLDRATAIANRRDAAGHDQVGSPEPSGGACTRL